MMACSIVVVRRRYIDGEFKYYPRVCMSRCSTIIKAESEGFPGRVEPLPFCLGTASVYLASDQEAV